MTRRCYRPGEIIAKLREVEIGAGNWRGEHNEICLHDCLGCRPLAPQIKPPMPAFALAGGDRLDPLKKRTGHGGLIKRLRSEEYM